MTGTVRAPGPLPRGVLLLLRNSWGEVEWVLPLLYRLRELEPRVRIFTVFPSDRFHEEGALCPTLRELLEAVSERIFTPRTTLGVDTDWVVSASGRPMIMERGLAASPELEATVARLRALARSLGELRASGRIGEAEHARELARLHGMCVELDAARAREREMRGAALERRFAAVLVEQELAGAPIDVILRDNATDFGFHIEVLERLAHVPVVRGAHGFDLTPRAPDDVYKPAMDLVDSVRPLAGRGDVWLCCSPGLAAQRSVYWRDERSAVVGFPRLDRGWVSHVLAASEREVAGHALPATRPRVLWITRQIIQSSMDRDTWTRVVRSTLRVFAARERVHLVVKPHPRQNLPELYAEMRALPRERWTLWRGSTVSAAAQCDVVVSVWSSAILDALAVGKPVIEYFEYAKESINQSRDAEGRITGGWRAHGLALPADSEADLHALLDAWERDPDDPRFVRQREAFAALHPEHADDTGRAVAEISRTLAARARTERSPSLGAST